MPFCDVAIARTEPCRKMHIDVFVRRPPGHTACGSAGRATGEILCTNCTQPETDIFFYSMIISSGLIYATAAEHHHHHHNA
jgi:hypothetical protein